ncbi:MAG: hypothetical protein NTX06_11125 [Proteobacteria bacterium]|nr:hypothetical protein [Pseudomonadota bacterium]
MKKIKRLIKRIEKQLVEKNKNMLCRFGCLCGKKWLADFSQQEARSCILLAESNQSQESDTGRHGPANNPLRKKRCEGIFLKHHYHRNNLADALNLTERGRTDGQT